MQRITITIDDALLDAVDAVVRQRGYTSRSEAFRDLVRDMMDREATKASDAPCVAALTYVYDHATRDLAQRLTHAQHAQHDLAVANLHMHLDHDSCLEVALLRGPAAAVRGFADALTTQRGVRHANLHVVPVTVTEAAHAHGDEPETHTHTHLRA